MKRYYTIINYLLCSICLLWMTGCSGILDDMRPKDQIPQDMLSESDLEKLLNVCRNGRTGIQILYGW